MMRFIAYILSFTLIAGYVSDLFAIPNNDTGIWVEICGSGKFIRIDLGNDENPLPQPIHNKVCHAVCCQNEDDIEGESGIE